MVGSIQVERAAKNSGGGIRYFTNATELQRAGICATRGANRRGASIGVVSREDERAGAELGEVTRGGGGIPGNGQRDCGVGDTDAAGRVGGESEVAIGGAGGGAGVFQGAAAEDEVACSVGRIADGASDSAVGDCGDAQRAGVDGGGPGVGIRTREGEPAKTILCQSAGGGGDAVADRGISRAADCQALPATDAARECEQVGIRVDARSAYEGDGSAVDIVAADVPQSTGVRNAAARERESFRAG